jgi:hypothetical protein
VPVPRARQQQPQQQQAQANMTGFVFSILPFVLLAHGLTTHEPNRLPVPAPPSIPSHWLFTLIVKTCEKPTGFGAKKTGNRFTSIIG